MKYAVMFEKTRTGYSAYVPDLPGCVAAAKSFRELERLIREAIQLHLDGLREDGAPIPKPAAICEYVESGEL